MSFILLSLYSSVPHLAFTFSSIAEAVSAAPSRIALPPVEIIIPPVADSTPKTPFTASSCVLGTSFPNKDISAADSSADIAKLDNSIPACLS